ncbi:MAG: Fic/DOC family protein [Flavisolibacter sp.]
MGVFDPDRHENILGITNLDELNVQEALGIIRAEEFILDLPLDFVFDVKLVLDIHTIAFGHLYSWAGKWRTEGTNIGIDKEKVPYAMVEYCDQVNWLKNNIKNEDELIHCLCYTHHRFTVIHPFNNGNGRTARLLTDTIAKMNGYQNINLYVRDVGQARTKYKAALRAADQYDDTLLKAMIKEGLATLD